MHFITTYMPYSWTPLRSLILLWSARTSKYALDTMQCAGAASLTADNEVIGVIDCKRVITTMHTKPASTLL